MCLCMNVCVYMYVCTYVCMYARTYLTEYCVRSKETYDVTLTSHAKIFLTEAQFMEDAKKCY